MSSTGRKPKPPRELRGKNINIAVTAYEKAAFEELALSEGTTTPELIRGLMSQRYILTMGKTVRSTISSAA